MTLDLNRLDELEKRATEGPWEMSDDFGTSVWAQAKIAHDYANNDAIYNTVCTLCDDEYQLVDARFITALRNSARAMIEEIRAGRAWLEAFDATSAQFMRDQESPNLPSWQKNADLMDCQHASREAFRKIVAANSGVKP